MRRVRPHPDSHLGIGDSGLSACRRRRDHAGSHCPSSGRGSRSAARRPGTAATTGAGPGRVPNGCAQAAEQSTKVPRLPKRDLTNLGFVTIDPPGAKDLDQAVFIERQHSGFVVWYAIADVAAFVTAGDPSPPGTGVATVAGHQRQCRRHDVGARTDPQPGAVVLCRGAATDRRRHGPGVADVVAPRRPVA